MKTILVILSVFFWSISFSQDDKEVTPPKIISKISLGEMVKMDDVYILFKEVITDSRCPKDVTCIWAGEATFVVEISTPDSEMEKQQITLTIPALEGNVSKLVSKVMEKNLYAFNLNPYPVSSVPAHLREYQLYVYLE